MDELIKNLVESYGPSGFEDNIRRIIQDEIAAFADEISVDSMGNLIALKKGDGSGLSVMVAAHMDEIGIMTTHITEKGFLRFTNIGGVRPQALMGSRVQFSDGTIGVIYCEKLDSWNGLHGQDKHYIDVGATSRELCPVGVGWAASFIRPFADIGGRYVSKSMDDRIGCAIGVESLRRISEMGTIPHDIFFVFSVQEEVGTRGAQTAANALKVDVGIALDVTLTGDTPEAQTMAVDLGAGPAIKVKDSGMISHAGLVRQMRSRAEEKNIPYQMEVLERGSTDARSIQIAGAGCAAGCISIPCRYVHTQSEIVDANDVENTVQLLVEILSNPIML
ncbi:MAG: M20/M25/M40 family metallo-hydrolase [Candidatus Promineifilaceae bacterium]